MNVPEAVKIHYDQQAHKVEVLDAANDEYVDLVQEIVLHFGREITPYADIVFTSPSDMRDSFKIRYTGNTLQLDMHKGIEE